MKEKSVDNIINSVKQHINAEFGIILPDEKIKGLAFSALRESGHVQGADKFKTYEHVGHIYKLFNESYKFDAGDEDLFTWEDIEYFTGNLFYTMKLATRRPLDEIGLIVAKCKENPDIKAKELLADLEAVQITIKRNMSDTWAHLEKIQKTGVGIIITKTLKFLIQKIEKIKEDQKK